MSGWGLGGWGLGTWGNGETTLTIELTGVSGSGAVGSLAPDSAQTLAGRSASGEIGTAIPNMFFGLTGEEAIGSLGAVIVPLLSNTAVGFVGTLGVDKAVALSGLGASGAVGSLGMGPRSVALTGNSARGDAGAVIAVYWKNINTVQTPNWAMIEN